MPTQIDPELQPTYDFVIQLLERAAGQMLSSEKKPAVVTILQELPAGATIREFYESIKAQEAEIADLSTVKSKALSPLLVALRKMQANGENAGLFSQITV